MPKISVIIPVYNVERYIRECLDSIKNQTYKDFEVLCTDDCGSDNSMNIVEEFAKADERFKIIKLNENKGPSVARNIALDKAQGQYIFFVDSDDIVSNVGAFEKVIQRFELTNADSVWFDYNVFEQRKMKRFSIPAVYPKDSPEGFFDITPENLLECPIYIWNKAYKTSVIQDMNLRFPVGLFYQDSEFYFRLFTKVKRINYIKEALYTYRVREGSTVTRSQTEDISRIKDMFVIFDNLVEYTKKEGIYEEYKIAFLKMMALRINCHKLPNQHDEAIRLSCEMLKKVNFPQDFKNYSKEAN